ncbi:MAG: RsmB/NOP family class I SAM-dependent RNA methyltransferase [Amylibacter sp.]
MTPNARYAAAIDVLGIVLNGEPAEKILTNWARSNRYAGSKDRAAVRDIVFDCLRRKRSMMHLAGFDCARGLVAGHIIDAGQAVEDVFTGERFAPDTLSENDRENLKRAKKNPPDAVRLDVPDWIELELRASLGGGLEASLIALQSRAPLDLRVNRKKAELAQVQAALLSDNIETDVIESVPNALRVTSNPRRVALSAAYQSGLVEIQDAGSQCIIDTLPLEGVKSVLDYCAGGGGKTLALADIMDNSVRFEAYDHNKKRMNDLPARAKRAGVLVEILQDDPASVAKTYDLVLLDVPCSGTGAWRRNPDGKWRFTNTDLQGLLSVQAAILKKAHKLVATDGVLAYVTCSLLRQENEDQVAAFLAVHNYWASIKSKRFRPCDGTDGFFVTLFKRTQS